jgi:hypothetical protein
MQIKKTTEHELVKICMTELCKKAGLAEPKNLVQRDQLFLCEHIQNKTGVLISLSTIKRLLNGQFSHLPQIATLDAIAVTSGYQSWQDFKLSKNLVNGTAGYDNRQSTNSKNKSVVVKFLALGSLLILISLGLLAIINIKKSGLANIDKAHFSAAKVTGNNIPNTVVFKYNVDSVTADSFFIQQSWDKNRRVRIDKNSHTLTDIYYEPGYHTAKLIANDKIIKTVAVSIPTDKWVYYAEENVPKSIPKYISTKGIKDGSMQLTREDVLSSKVDVRKNNKIVQVYFPSLIKNSSDNFVLRYKVKVNALNNEACPYLMSEVFCQKRFMYFISTLKGCTSELVAQFGDNELNGKTSDLSMLGSDIKSWQNMELRVQNKKVSISINNVEVFSAAYHDSCGLITGLGFISNGLCQVDFVDFKTLDGKVIYSNDFNQ